MFDEFDRKILDALRSEGRLTNFELAEKVHLSASQCSRRRIRLEESGVINAYRAEVDLAALGFTVGAFVNISQIGQSPARRAKLHHFIMHSRAVLSCQAVAGTADYILRVVTRDLAELNQFVLALIDSSDSPLQVHSMIILESIKEYQVASYPLF